jgi:Flp pilus assembly protein TadG
MTKPSFFPRFRTFHDVPSSPAGSRAAGRRWFGLRRCRRGSITTEFGLILLPFTIFFTGLVEVAWQATTAAVLDVASLRASRFGVTGQQRLTATPAEVACRSLTIPWMISASTRNFLKSSRVTVTTQTWGSIGGMQAAATPATGAGMGGQMTVYTVEYRQPYLTLGILGSGAVRTHRATVTVQNEPFSNAVC